jgi:hypothetical protein
LSFVVFGFTASTLLRFIVMLFRLGGSVIVRISGSRTIMATIAAITPIRIILRRLRNM